MSSKFQPALLGGLVLGVLSALPIVSIGNVCCCLWVISGGVLAAYLLQRNQADAHRGRRRRDGRVSRWRHRRSGVAGACDSRSRS